MKFKVDNYVCTDLGIGKVKEVSKEYQNYIVEGSNWIWIFTEKELEDASEYINRWFHS